LKPETEKIKGRTTYGATDPSWKATQKAAKLTGKPISLYLRDAVDEITKRDLKAGK